MKFLSPSLVCLVMAAGLWAQDPADSYDRPPGNVNELTLATFQPGTTTLAAVMAKLGPHWSHPSEEETSVYVWCDATTHLRLTVDVGGTANAKTVVAQVITASEDHSPGCAATLPHALARTGRGVALGATKAKLLASYGKPFFIGPSTSDGTNVTLIVFNFSWAGADKPQILESSFDAAGHLVKMTLSAQYY